MLKEQEMSKPKFTSANNEKQIAVFSGIQSIASQNSAEEASDNLCSNSLHLTLLVQTNLLSSFFVLLIHKW